MQKTIIDCDRCGQVLPSSSIQSSAQVVMFHRAGPADVTTAYFCYTAKSDGSPSCGDLLLDAVRELATAEDVVPPAPAPAPLVDPNTQLSGVGGGDGA